MQREHIPEPSRGEMYRMQSIPPISYQQPGGPYGGANARFTKQYAYDLGPDASQIHKPAALFDGRGTGYAFALDPISELRGHGPSPPSLGPSIQPSFQSPRRAASPPSPPPPLGETLSEWAAHSRVRMQGYRLRLSQLYRLQRNSVADWRAAASEPPRRIRPTDATPTAPGRRHRRRRRAPWARRRLS